MATRKKDNRETIAPIGEYYSDLLAIDAHISGKTKSAQATSLLCAKLQEREELIEKRLKYLAGKRGISVDDFRSEILRDT